MKKFLLIVLVMLTPTCAHAGCQPVYIMGQGYTEVCTPDPLPVYPAPAPPCVSAAGNCE